MKKITLLIIVLIFGIKSGNSQLVFICTGEYAKVYHSKSNCNGLSNCKADIIQVFQSDAINKFNLKRPCCICWYPSPIGCATDDLPVKNQVTKFNPYIPQGPSNSSSSTGGGSTEAAYLAAGIVGLGAAINSNDFYIHYFNSNNARFNNNNRFIEDHGFAFGLRKTFNRSAIEYGASLIPQNDFSGEEGGNTKWGAHFNYLYNIPVIKNSDKLNLYLGATINSFFTKSDPFGGGGIGGLNIKLFSWLKIDTRYEMTTTTERISSGFFLTYNKN